MQAHEQRRRSEKQCFGLQFVWVGFLVQWSGDGHKNGNRCHSADQKGFPQKGECPKRGLGRNTPRGLYLMKVTVKLYSGLERYVQHYDPESGIILRLPNGSKVRDLITVLDLPPHGARFVSVGGQIKKADDEVAHGDHVKIFALSAGG